MEVSGCLPTWGFCLDWIGLVGRELESVIGSWEFSS